MSPHWKHKTARLQTALPDSRIARIMNAHRKQHLQHQFVVRIKVLGLMMLSRGSILRDFPIVRPVVHEHARQSLLPANEHYPTIEKYL